MSDIKLFRTHGSHVTELEGKSVTLEKSLQTLIESNLEAFLGIRFLATEYSIGKPSVGESIRLGSTKMDGLASSNTNGRQMRM